MDDDRFTKNSDGWVYTGSEERVIIPDYLFDKAVTEIPSLAFRGSKIQEVVLPKTVKTINKSAFLMCAELRSINLENITVIGNNAFSLCTSLLEVYLSDNVTKIDSYAFDQCYNLKKVRLPASIDYIGAYAFSETGIEQITLSDGISYVANSLFYQCYKLKSVKLPKSVSTIGVFAFAECPNLSDINIPSNAEIHETAFSGSPSVPLNAENSMHASLYTDSIPEIIIDPITNTIKVGKQREHEKATSIHTYLDEYSELIRKGWEYVKKQEMEKALQQYNTAVALNSSSPLAYEKLGDAYYMMEEYQKSVNMYYIAYALYDNNESLLKSMGHALLDAKTLSEYPKMINAVKLYRKRLLPEIFGCEIPKTAEKLLFKYTKRCIASAKEYIANNEKPVIPTEEIAANDEKPIIPVKRAAENAVYTDERILTEQGANLKRQGHYQEAKQKYIEAIRLNRQYASAYSALGKTLYILGEYKASVRAYETAIELQQNSHQQDVMRHMGHALQDEKDGTDKNLIAAYRSTIDPYWANNNRIGHVSRMEYEKYENNCIDAAKHYMSEV